MADASNGGVSVVVLDYSCMSLQPNSRICCYLKSWFSICNSDGFSTDASWQLYLRIWRNLFVFLVRITAEKVFLRFAHSINRNPVGFELLIYSHIKLCIGLIHSAKRNRLMVWWNRNLAQSRYRAIVINKWILLFLYGNAFYKWIALCVGD